MPEAAENAERFISGKGRADLDTDPMLLFALVRAIEIIGEAASKVSADQRVASATMPWSDIVADAQSTRSCLLRYRPGHRMEDGNGGDSIASFPAAATPCERTHGLSPT